MVSTMIHLKQALIASEIAERRERLVKLLMRLDNLKARISQEKEKINILSKQLEEL